MPVPAFYEIAAAAQYLGHGVDIPPFFHQFGGQQPEFVLFFLAERVQNQCNSSL
jgi:hypothetical protein